MCLVSEITRYESSGEWDVKPYKSTQSLSRGEIYEETPNRKQNIEV